MFYLVCLVIQNQPISFLIKISSQKLKSAVYLNLLYVTNYWCWALFTTSLLHSYNLNLHFLSLTQLKVPYFASFNRTSYRIYQMALLCHAECLTSCVRQSALWLSTLFCVLPDLNDRTLTCGFVRSVPCVTTAVPWSGRTAAGAPWRSCGRRGRRTACTPPALCGRHRCSSACLCRTPQWRPKMGRIGQSGET